MERQLFDYEDWDGEFDCMIFYNITLKKQIGPYEIGTKFDSAMLMYDEGILQLCRTKDIRGEKDFKEVKVVSECKLELTVTEVRTKR